MLTIKNMYKKYKDFQLEDINLCLSKGRVMGVVGKKGAGKSSVVNAIANLIPIDSGEIKIFDKRYERDEIEIKEKTAFVFEKSSYYKEFTPKKYGEIVGVFYNEWNMNKYQEYLKRFCVNKEQKIGELTAEKTLAVHVAFSLSYNANLIVVDGVEKIDEEEVLSALKEYAEKGDKSVLFTGEDASTLEKIVDCVTIMNKGRIVCSGEKDELIGRYRIVKGKVEDLGLIDSKRIFGLKKGQSDFKALIESGGDFIEDFEFRRPKLDEIVGYLCS